MKRGDAAPVAVLIAGPTASGKSALALELARLVGGVVVNADALQVYDALRVVTARPGPAEEASAPHRLYGHVHGSERYSVGRWLSDVAAVLSEAKAKGQVPIVVGGTGLYFMALTMGLAEVPAISPEIRAKWRDAAAKDGPALLHRQLDALDPEGAAAIQPTDTVRIVRALEVVDGTGRPLTEWQRDKATPALVDPASALRVVIEVDRTELFERIGLRLDQMVGAGALDEVRALQAQRLDPALPVMKAVGVREFLGHVSGELSVDEALRRAKTETRRYAKRQMTWFRNQMDDWPRFDPGNIRKAAEALAQQTKK